MAICMSVFICCDSSRPEVQIDDTTDNGISNNESKKQDIADSLAKAKEDSIEKAREDSIRQEASIKKKDLQDQISAQEDSISELNKRIASLENKAEGMLGKSSAYTFMFLEFLALCLIMWFLYSKLNKRIQKIKKAIKDLQRNDRGLSEVEVNNKIWELAKQINTKNSSQDKRIDEIEEKIRLLTKNQEPQGPYSQFYPNSQQHKVIEPQGVNSPKKQKVFYMPRTLTPMQFENSRKKMNRDDSTYFKFTEIRPGEAEFVFDPYDSVCISKAYDSRDDSLLTVCELDSKSATPNQYINIEPGKAKLEGNVWIVTKKLKLQYV